MRHDQPLTAFALDSSGAGARHMGASHTITLRVTTPESEGAGLLRTALQADGRARVLGHSVRTDAPLPLTVTL